jgi:transcription termination/antitermination protein NusG
MLVFHCPIMQYYTIHVLTGAEDDFVRRLLPALGKDRLILPKKLMPIRRKGVKLKELQPLFPGYLFLQSDDILVETDVYWAIRRTEGFIRFLRESASPSPLSERDLGLIRQFITFGKYADTSKVTFDENDRIVVLEGPLKGLEGRIIKVNRRKGRAKVRFDFYETSYPVDLGFEVVERVKSGGGTVHEESGA